MQSFRYKTILNGAFLVAGTAIGGGMLALPVITAELGFTPSFLSYLLISLFVLATGIVIFELCSWFDGEVNLITLAQRTLGSGGAMVMIFFYLLLFLTLILAYEVGGGEFVAAMSGHTLSAREGSILFTLIFGLILYLGPSFALTMNTLFACGMALSYFYFLYQGIGKIDVERLQGGSLSHIIKALPILFTSFAYQGVVPSLTHYLEGRRRDVLQALLIGNGILFLVYLFWQGLILGLIPLEGEQSLLQAQRNGESAIAPLRHLFPGHQVLIAGEIFSFFALTTSLIGVALSMVDFLFDGLKWQRGKGQRALLLGLILLLPLFFSFFKHKIFLQALNIAGGFGVAILLGLLPLLMLYRGRYQLHLGKEPILIGGKPMLIALLLFVMGEILFLTLHLVMGV